MLASRTVYSRQRDTAASNTNSDSETSEDSQNIVASNGFHLDDTMITLWQEKQQSSIVLVVSANERM